LGGRGRWISEFKASLVYRVSSRIARTTQRNPVSKNQKKKKKGMNMVHTHTCRQTFIHMKEKPIFECINLLIRLGRVLVR
jgi:hypothetical protein